MSQLAIVEAFANLPDTRRKAGQRHHQALCLALFTLAVAAGNRGFLAIGDWLNAHRSQNVGQSHAILPSICIAIMAFKT
jgi:hypothetical protein